MTEGGGPQLFVNRFAGAGPAQEQEQGPAKDRCDCLPLSRRAQGRTVRFHPELQDTTAPGWLRLLDLVEEAAADGREEFRPLTALSNEERRQVVTLPPTIAKLTAVRSLVLYGSNLVRIPPEIGAMASLEQFEPYTSHRLHWYPYELTRCAKLTRSTVSTRALYGNFKYRPPFPALAPVDGAAAPDLRRLDPAVWGAESVAACSVCDGPVQAAALRQVWISLEIATDVLPMLVNACSEQCVGRLPAPAEDHVPTVHRGGPTVAQPESDW